MTQVGSGVEIPIKGDTSQVRKAVDEVIGSFDKLVGRANQLEAALADDAVTSKLTAEGLQHLQKEAAAARAKVDALTQSTEQMVHVKSRAREVASQLDERFGKLQVSIGGMSQALGGASGRFGDLIGGAADLAMTFAAGGPMMAGIAAVGAGVAYAIGEISKAQEAAATAAKDSAAQMDKLKAKAEAAADALAAAKEGVSVETIQDRRTMGGATAQLGSAAGAVGGAFKAAGGSDLGFSAALADPTRDLEDAYKRAAAQAEGMIDPARKAKVQAALEEYRKSLDQLTIIQRTQADQEQKKLVDELRAWGESVVDAAKNTKALSAAAAVATESFDALAEVRNMFASIKAAGTKSPMSFANPEISQDAALDTVGLGSPAIEISTQFSEVLDATAEEMASWGEVLDETEGEFTDLMSPVERFGKSLSDLGESLMDTVTSQGTIDNVVSGAMGQGGFDAAGADIGGVIGGFLGPVGAAVGKILGSLMGNALDELVKVLGVVTPLMDGLAIGIAALAPIFIVLKVLSAELGNLFVQLAPLLLVLAKPISALLLVVIRLVQVIMPFIYMLVLVITALLSFVDFITIGVSLLDTYFFQPLIAGVRWIYNGLVSFYNMIIDIIRKVPGLGKFGSKAEAMSTFSGTPLDNLPNDVADLADIMAENTDATEDNTQVTGDINQELTNLPSGYKIAGAEYNAADGVRMQPMINIVVEKWFGSSTPSEDIKDLHKKAKFGTKGTFNGRRFASDEKG